MVQKVEDFFVQLGVGQKGMFKQVALFLAVHPVSQLLIPFALRPAVGVKAVPESGFKVNGKGFGFQMFVKGAIGQKV